MLTADDEAGDTLLRIFSQNTLPLYRSGLFFHNLWDTCVSWNSAALLTCKTQKKYDRKYFAIKKSLSFLTVIAALSGSASAYVPAYYAPGSLTPADWQPTYNVEALYALGEYDVPDAWGIRGSFCLYDSGEFGSDKTHFNGFTMGVGAGLKFICGERFYVKIGYELNRTFISDNVGVNINQHVITAGIGTQF